MTVTPSPTTPPDQIPEALRGLPFVVGEPGQGQVVGLVGSSVRLSVPTTSTVLAASSRYVVTAKLGKVPAEDVTVYDLQGDTASALTYAIGRPVSSAAIAGDVVLLAGPAPSGVDGGVTALDLRTRTTMQLVKPGGAVSRQNVRAVLLSSSGQTAVSASCTSDGSGCTADVIDVKALKAVRTVDLAGSPSAATDEIVLVRPDGSTISGVDLLTGKPRWSHCCEEYDWSYAIPNGFIVAKGSYPFRLLLVDAMSGVVTTKLERATQDHWTLWPSLSTSSAAIFSPNGLLAETAADSGRIVGDLLDLDTGQVTEHALDIGARP
ncbi:MAG TPA: hypothetical protein VFW92_04725 [Candidatus Limnocylindrales bacterium]|nr:hypothetical protein [Candidatus Limnocylindrales bacterium]